MKKPIVDPVQLTADLVRCPSVTPREGGAITLLETLLSDAGFACTRIERGGVSNLFARWGNKGAARSFGFNGHTDVVPVGDEAAWSLPPFGAEEKDGKLWGRGATDMKSGVAAFVAAAIDHVTHTPPEDGAVIVTITGDEEGDAEDGTSAILDWMAEEGERMDVCVVGEPTCPETLGDMIKIGRRGSVNMWITVHGMQGHVAYPQNADNPITKLGRILTEIDSLQLDEGTDWFQPSNIEFTDLHVGNPAHNVIPAKAEGRLSIRFNDRHSGESLSAMVQEIVTRHGGELKPIISGEPFLTPPGEFSDIVAGAIREVTGVDPELSTSGGTSDARFLAKIMPVVEFGLCNATMHKLDEAVAIDDLDQLSKIFALIVERALR